jgi:hypothetical protein
MNGRKRPAAYSFVAGLLSLGFESISRCDDLPGSWSQFRGPQGNGVAAQAHPTNWIDEEQKLCGASASRQPAIIPAHVDVLS